MSIRLRRTLIAVLVAIAVVGVIAILPGSHPAGTKVIAMGGGSGATGTRPIRDALVTGGAAQVADPTGAPPTSDQGTPSGTGAGSGTGTDTGARTGTGTGTGTGQTSTSVAASPTTRGGGATTTTIIVRPPSGPATVAWR